MRLTLVRRPRTQIAALTLLALVLGAVSLSYAQTPVAVFSQANGLLSGSTGVPGAGGGGYGGTVTTRVSANSRGDVIAAVSSNCGNGGSTFILEVPGKSSATPQTTVNLLTGMGCPYGGPSAYVDSRDNIYVADTADAAILYIPIVNGTYPTNAVYSSLTNCSAFPVPATQATTCIVPLNYPSTLGYYIQVGDLGMDGAGNLYLLDKYTGGSPSAYPNNDVLIRVNAADGSFSLLNTTLSNDANGKIAVDKAGDVLVDTYGSVTLYLAPNYTSGQGVNSLNDPQGVSVDSGGNFYISDQLSSGNNFIEIPASSIAAGNVNNNFLVTNQVGSYFGSQSSEAIGIDGFGELYYAGGYPNSISYAIAGKLNFGTQAVGAGAGGSQTLNVVFNAAVSATPTFTVQPAGAFTVTGNTCTAGSYAAAGNCSVSLTYSATATGAQNATLQILSGVTVLGTATLSGNGTAPELNVDPGSIATDGTGYKAPSAVAVDASGNIFVADKSTGNIYETTTGSTAAATAVVTGFTAPSAVAVDGSDNLYVADSGSIFEVPYNGTAYGSKVTLYTGLSGASGLALDTAGDLYVADSGNARVLRLSYNDGLPLGSLVVNFGSGYTTPVAVAVDNTGNFVYVVDSGTESVVQVGIYTLAQASVVTGLTTPTGIATDAAGSIYVVDNGAATVTRVPNIGGAINNNQASKLALIVTSPNAIATDASGNLYVADTADQAIATDTRSSSTLNFGYINEGQSSSTVSAQLSNSGNATTTFNTPFYSQTGAPAAATASFAIQPSTTCASGQSVNQGASCLVAANFSPLITGQLTDTLAFSSNANAASLVLTGTGTNLAQTTTTLKITSPLPPVQPTFGQSITVQATVAPAPGNGTPGGTVTFYLDNVVQGTVTLSNGAASYTFTGLLGGQHTINASYSGDTVNYASSNTNANPLVITVGTTTSTTSLAISGTPALYANPTSANPGQSVTLTATVTPGAPGTPTGTVVFYNGTTQLNTGATVVPITINKVTYYQATYTTTSLATGQDSLTAQYSGDSNYSGSTSSPGVLLLVSNQTIAITSSSSTIAGGGAVTLTISSVAGFNNDAVDLACTGLPAYSTCSFSPSVAVVAPAVPAVITMQVVINQAPVIAPGNAAGFAIFNGRLGLLLTALLVLPLAWLARRRRFGRALFSLLLLFGLAVSVTACGTGTNASYTTPKGTYNITVTGTINTSTNSPSTPVVAATLPLTLTVN